MLIPSRWQLWESDGGCKLELCVCEAGVCAPRSAKMAVPTPSHQHAYGTSI